MLIEIKIPSVGESITEVQIAEWLKAEGDEVKKDENIATIDSEKATFELPSPEIGVLSKILRQAGEPVKIGEAIARLETNGQAETAKPPVPETEREDASTTPAAGTAENEAPAEAPAAVKKEKEKPADLKQEAKEKAVPQIEKTAPESPPKQAAPVLPSIGSAPKRPASASEKKVPMSMLRRTAARRLVEAKQEMAMLTTFNEVDMSVVQALRREHQEAFEKQYQVRLGLMSFFVKAVADGLRRFPQINARIDGNDILYRDYFNVSVAIASDRGLVVPVLRNAGRMSFAEIEKAVADLAKRARDGVLKPEEFEGGTFTITNGGIFGSLLSTPIINPPQSGILGMHAIQERPVALQGQVVIRPMMYLALTYDHRIVDGREAVLFLQRIKQTIENPSRLLIEI